MLFNSTAFLVFFPIVYVGYLALGRFHKAQNLFLLLASLYFYASWDYRFLGLLALSGGIDYVAALEIHAAHDAKVRKRFLLLSLVSNLTILGFFKYFNFFADNTTRLLHLVGMHADPITLEVILPIGISFYTFQAMSYAIDVYRGHIEPCRSPIDYALFIAFFPHLVAGPIQVPSVLLPQIMRPRKLDVSQINAGVYLVLTGLVKKMVIADNMALLANPIFDQYRSHSGLDTLVAALAFTVQIYCDFSGYSDIARGLSKLMGFELLVNFKLPYFALNPTDFWQRWHISLSTWLREYLYIPLGGNRGSALATYRNLALTMILGGLWHGASWNFVTWGAYHGALLIGYRILDKTPEHEDPWSGAYSYVRVVAKMALMFSFTVIGWVIFRSHSVDQFVQMLLRLGVQPSAESSAIATRFLLFAAPLFLVQTWQYRTRNLLAPLAMKPLSLALTYAALVASIVVFGVRESIEFIYFQF
jgi:D-alanyl-lipoteichoic acid acyltransferase DltB (MBOAT superfamily)